MAGKPHLVLQRREFLVLLGGAVGLLTACAPTAPAAAPAVAPTSPAPAVQSPVAGASTVAPAQATLQTINVAAIPTVAYAGIYIGMERGYYKDQGLQLSPVTFAGAADTVASLGAGQIDISNVDAGAAVWNFLGRGVQLRFVADGNHGEANHSGNAWMIRKDLIDSGAFKDLTDLRGKTVSPVGKGSLIESQFSRSLEQVGLKDTDVNVQYIGFADCLPAFANKALDAAVLTEPFVANAVGQGLAVRWKGMEELLGNYQGTMIMLSQQMAEQRQEAANRFVVAYVRSIRDYLDAFFNGVGYDDVVGILTRTTNLTDPAIYKKIVVPAFDSNGAMLVDDVVNLERWYSDHGYVSTPVDARKPFDTSYLENAWRSLGKR